MSNDALLLCNFLSILIQAIIVKVSQTLTSTKTPTEKWCSFNCVSHITTKDVSV
jgi:hypothetical protein